MRNVRFPPKLAVSGLVAAFDPFLPLAIEEMVAIQNRRTAALLSHRQESLASGDPL
jgi:hypothetical protein